MLDETDERAGDHLHETFSPNSRRSWRERPQRILVEVAPNARPLQRKLQIARDELESRVQVRTRELAAVNE